MMPTLFPQANEKGRVKSTDEISSPIVVKSTIDSALSVKRREEKGLKCFPLLSRIDDEIFE